jgi:phage-related baseplate assembly protein
VKVLPKLALIDSPDFDVILKEVSASFASIVPEDLRKDVQHRAETAKKAAAIASKMAKLFPK